MAEPADDQAGTPWERLLPYLPLLAGFGAGYGVFSLLVMRAWLDSGHWWDLLALGLGSGAYVALGTILSRLVGRQVAGDEG